LIRNNITVFRSHQVDTLKELIPLSKGIHTLVCMIPPDVLREGDYLITPLISIHMLDWILKDSPPLAGFTIVFDANRSFFNMLINDRNHPGIIFPQLYWTKE